MVIGDLIVGLTAAAAIGGMLVLAYGYRASLFSADPATRLFAWSTVLLALSVAARRLHWDMIQPIHVGSFDQRPMNTVYNLVAIAAVYFGLRARLWLIPEAERGRWHWWSAWAHPGVLRVLPDRPLGTHEPPRDT